MENVFAQRSSDITEPADEVALIAHELESQGRFGLTRGFIQHGDVSVYHHMLSVARASLAAAQSSSASASTSTASLSALLSTGAPLSARRPSCAALSNTP